MMGIFRFFFNSVFIFLMIVIGVSYYYGYCSGQDEVEAKAVANGYGRYIKSFKDNPDGSREVLYTFCWTDQIPEGAVTVKFKPSRWETWSKNAGLNEAIEKAKRVQLDRTGNQNDKATSVRN